MNSKNYYGFESRASLIPEIRKNVAVNVENNLITRMIGQAKYRAIRESRVYVLKLGNGYNGELENFAYNILGFGDNCDDHEWKQMKIIRDIKLRVTMNAGRE